MCSDSYRNLKLSSDYLLVLNLNSEFYFRTLLNFNIKLNLPDLRKFLWALGILNAEWNSGKSNQYTVTMATQYTVKLDSHR